MHPMILFYLSPFVASISAYYHLNFYFLLNKFILASSTNKSKCCVVSRAVFCGVLVLFGNRGSRKSVCVQWIGAGRYRGMVGGLGVDVFLSLTCKAKARPGRQGLMLPQAGGVGGLTCSKHRQGFHMVRSGSSEVPHNCGYP